MIVSTGVITIKETKIVKTAVTVHSHHRWQCGTSKRGLDLLAIIRQSINYQTVNNTMSSSQETSRETGRNLYGVGLAIGVGVLMIVAAPPLATALKV